MITHIVMLKLKPEIKSDEIENMHKKVLDTKLKISEIKNVKPVDNFAIERRSLGFNHGFQMEFEDRQALKTYYNHPVHKELSNYLRGIAELLVLDYEDI